MQVRPRAYPHPVLSTFSDDIVGSAIQSTIVVRGNKTSYLFDVTIKTGNRDLEKLISARSAKYAVHVECATTRYRGLFPSIDERFSFEIPAHLIDGRVELCSFILANDRLPKYRNAGFHKDYGAMTFVVQKADTLAVAGDQVFSADKDIDPLKRIPSIFSIVPNEDDDPPPIDINTSGAKIVISLSPQNYKTYAFLRLSQPMHAVLNSMIIIPALVAVLDDVRRAAGNPDELTTFESRRWYRTMVRRLRDLGVNPADADAFELQSSVSLAHRLVGNPVSESLTTLKGLEEMDDE
jgi:hypothetical protein